MKDYLATFQEDELAGLQLLTRFDTVRIVYPSLLIVCGEVEDALPDTIRQSGNWMSETELTLISKRKRTTGDKHDDYAGCVTDLLLATNVVATLNDIAADRELQVCGNPRVTGRTNEVDDERNENVTRIRWTIHLVPNVTAG